MSELQTLGIGFDTNQATVNAKAFDAAVRNMTGGIKNVSGASQSMVSSMIQAEAILNAVKVATRAVNTELKAVIDTGAKFEATMSKVKAVSNATESQFKSLTKAAKQMGETTEFSASQAADGLVLLAQAGLNPTQGIAALPHVLNLASAGGLSLAESADIATNAMSGMRLGVQDLPRIVDIFAATASRSNTDVRMMGEAFTYAASVASATGVSIEELSAMIGILGNAGIQGSMAGTQLAFGMSKAAKEGKSFLGTLEEFQKTGYDAAKVMDEFGERAGRGALAILGQGTETVRGFQQGLREAANEGNRMAVTMRDNLTGDLKALDSAIEAVRIDVFETFGPELRLVVQAVTASVRENKETFAQLADILKIATTNILRFGSTSENVASGAQVLIDSFKVAASAAVYLTAAVKNAHDAVALWSSALGYLSVGDFSAALDSAGNIIDSFTKNSLAAEDAIRRIWAVVPKATKAVEAEATSTTGATVATQKNIDAVLKKADSIETLNSVLDMNTMNQREIIDVTDLATQAIQRQAEAFRDTGDAAGTASGKISGFTEATTNFSGTSLAGTTFSLPTKGLSPFAGILPATSDSTVAAIPAGGINTADLNEIMKRAEAIQYAFMAEDEMLSQLRQKLVKLANDYSKINKDSLEEQLDNLEEQKRILNQIEGIESRQNQEKLSNLAKQQALLDDFSSQAQELDLSGLVPTDLLNAWQTKYQSLQAQVNALDFSNITEADTALISEFKKASEAYLTTAADVLKSSSQYTDIKNAVSVEFKSIADNIKQSMAPAAFAAEGTAFTMGGLAAAMGGIITNEPKSTAGLNKTSEALSGMNIAAGGAATGAQGLGNELAGTQSPFQQTSNAMGVFADNLVKIATQIQQTAQGQTPAGGSGITQTPGGTTGGTTATPKTFSRYENRAGSLIAVWSDGSITTVMSSGLTSAVWSIQEGGQKAIWDTGASAAGATRFFGFSGGDPSARATVYNPSFGYPQVPSYSSFSKGSWGIKGTTPALLHDGEMVIRREDAPVVQQTLRSTGQSANYGVSPGGSSGKLESMVQQLVILTGNLLDAISALADRPVVVDVRSTSDALLRFNRTRGTA